MKKTDEVLFRAEIVMIYSVHLHDVGSPPDHKGSVVGNYAAIFNRRIDGGQTCTAPQVSCYSFC